MDRDTDKVMPTSIKSKSPFELAMEISDVYFDIESAARLIANTKKILTENEILSIYENMALSQRLYFLTISNSLRIRININS
ncbi:MAG: hypothetical protein WBX01_13635 [Nitrososphaeraceae archaeon]